MMAVVMHDGRTRKHVTDSRLYIATIEENLSGVSMEKLLLVTTFVFGRRTIEHAKLKIVRGD